MAVMRSKDVHPETLARVRAAIAYTVRPQTEIAEALGVSDRTFETWKKEGIQRPAVSLRIIAEECGLPVDFFFADFRRLSEIVPATSPAPTGREGGPDPSGTEQALRAAHRAAQPGATRRQARRDRQTG